MQNGAGLYVHIPFCERKCGYCDFPSLPRGIWDDDTLRLYVAAVRHNIRRINNLIKSPVAVDTVFFGGGTPSILDPFDIGSILTVLRAHFIVDPESEITLETNPGTVTPEKLERFRLEGINRLSIGAQSLRNENLQALGRIHNRSAIFEMYEAARDIGFTSINLDFIYGIPGQTVESWKEELWEILTLAPPHLSLYNLIPEEGTPMGDRILSGVLAIPDEDEQVAMMEITHHMLVEKGYRHYEISNFALPGHESRHNLKYWRSDDYFGFGSAAFSYWKRRRFSNVRDPFVFIERMEQGRSAIDFSERLPVERQMGEYLMMVLRLEEGVSTQEFFQRFGLEMEEVYREAVAELTRKGWLAKKAGESPEDMRFFTPHEYFRIQSEIAERFI